MTEMWNGEVDCEKLRRGRKAVAATATPAPERKLRLEGCDMVLLSLCLYGEVDGADASILLGCPPHVRGGQPAESYRRVQALRTRTSPIPAGCVRRRRRLRCP